MLNGGIGEMRVVVGSSSLGLRHMAGLRSEYWPSAWARVEVAGRAMDASRVAVGDVGCRLVVAERHVPRPPPTLRYQPLVVTPSPCQSAHLR